MVLIILTVTEKENAMTTTISRKNKSVKFDVDDNGCPRVFLNCQICGETIIAKLSNGFWIFKIGCNCAHDETDWSYETPISYIDFIKEI